MQNVIYKDDKNYPSLLKKIGKDAPKQLYYKTRGVIPNLIGNPDLDSRFRGNDTRVENDKNTNDQKIQSAYSNKKFDIFNNCLGVVGSRKLTHYGEQAIERIVGELAMSSITIVSGFMYGGDALAHQTAIRVGGRTIAVMPCGIDRISPEDQKELYNDILENQGMIISEYEGEMAPALWTYPRRNRIVAGLSQAILVIEAGEKSGSLITANLAKKFKRKIFAVPGPITSSVSVGTNRLIKDGAEMVTDAKDILRWFRKNEHQAFRCHSASSSGVIPNLIGNPDLDSRFRGNDTKKNENSKNSVISTEAKQKEKSLKDEHSEGIPHYIRNNKGIESQILDFLEREALGIDEMSRHLEISVSELGVKLSIMEMQGLIELKGDKYYNVK